jgi:cytochrome P450
VTDAASFDEIFPGWREHPSMGVESIMNLNEPEHTRIRSLIARAFTPRRAAGLEPAIARMTDRLLDAMADRGADGSAAEFMHDFAFLLPITVICELIGIPEADREGFRPIARNLAATLEPGIDPLVLADADIAAMQLQEYFTALAAERREDPRHDP